MTSKIIFNKKTILASIIGLALIAAAAWFSYSRFKKDPIQEIVRKAADNQVIRNLNQNPEYIMILQPETLPEYFRQRLIYFAGVGREPYAALSEEITMKFPGEKGRVINEILSTWKLYAEGKQILKDKNTFEYDYLTGLAQLRNSVFGKNLAAGMFPGHSSDTIALFYAWAFKFLQTGERLTAEHKKIKIGKKRAELYGNDYDFLLSVQPPEKEFALQKEIIKRELQVMNPTERKKVLDEIRESLSRE